MDSSNPIERLRATNAGIERGLSYGMDKLVYNGTRLGGILPGFILKMAMGTPSSVFGTNSTDIPLTSRSQFYILGHPVKNVYLFPPIEKTPVGMFEKANKYISSELEWAYSLPLHYI